MFVSVGRGSVATRNRRDEGLHSARSLGIYRMPKIPNPGQQVFPRDREDVPSSVFAVADELVFDPWLSLDRSKPNARSPCHVSLRISIRVCSGPENSSPRRLGLHALDAAVGKTLGLAVEAPSGVSNLICDGPR